MVIETRNDNLNLSPEELLERAEDLLENSASGIDEDNRPRLQSLISELRVKRTELETQQTTLRRLRVDLDKRRHRYEDLYEHAPVGYLSLDRDGTICEANRTAAQLLGVQREALAGSRLADFIHANNQGTYNFFCQRVRESRSRHLCDVKLADPNALVTHLTLEGVSERRKDGSAGNIIAILHDMTQRHRVEEIIRTLNVSLQQRVGQQTSELRRVNRELEKKIREREQINQALLAREAKLNSILNATADGIVTVDQRGLIESFNAGAEKIFGYREEDILGINIGTLVTPADRERFLQQVGRASLSETNKVGGITWEVEGRDRNGNVIPVEVSVSQFSIGDKRHFIGIVRDVTEKKRKAQQDRERLDQLAHASRLSMMGEMASGLAHEVNQPLTAIASYLQACKRLLKAGGNNKAKLDIAMENAEKQAMLAGQIIHRMREFVSTHKLHRSTVDINALILDAFALCAAECRKHQIVKHFDLADTLPCVHADSVYIEQVLLNLLRNSIEAMSCLPKNVGRVLSVKTHINLQKQLQVTVQDNGPGVQSGQMDHVFTPFYTTKKTGMGLGLSISRSIIETHGGTLWTAPTREKGAAFHFTLPLPSDVESSK